MATDSATIAATAHIQGIDFSGMFFGAIKKPIYAQLQKTPLWGWPYYKELGIVCAGLILFVILIWLYKNWIR